MPRANSTFRQIDVIRLIKAVQKAGLSIGRVGFRPDGTILVETGEPEAMTPIDKEPSIRDTIARLRAERELAALNGEDKRRRGGRTSEPTIHEVIAQMGAKAPTKPRGKK